MAQITKDSPHIAFIQHFFCNCSWGSRPPLSSRIMKQPLGRNARSPNSRGCLSLNLKTGPNEASGIKKGETEGKVTGLTPPVQFQELRSSIPSPERTTVPRW